MEQYLKDENFESQHAEKCDLFVELSPARISYAIVDDVSNQLQVLFSSRIASNILILDKLDTLFNTHTELQLPFRQIKIGLQTSHFTFIPDELFDPSLVKEYAKFTQSGTHMDHRIQINDIKSVGIKNIVTIDLELQKALQTRFHQAQFFSQADSFIAGMDSMIEITKLYTIFVDKSQRSRALE